MSEDGRAAPDGSRLGNHRPLAASSTIIDTPPLTSPSTDTAVGSQQWSPPKLKRARTDSETPASPISNFDPEKTSRSTTFSLPRRESTLTTLDELEYAIHGYPRLATFMGHEPGAAIYRRFASLNARILLYRQAEIVCLEYELDQLEKDFAHHKHIHHSIRGLIHANPGTVGERVWKKIQQLDTALERYNALLLQQKSLYELPAANDIDTNDLNNFIHNEEMGGRWLSHPEDTIWETIQPKGSKKYKAEQRDLVRLSGDDRYEDPFTRFLWGPFLQLFHSVWSKIRHPNLPAGAYEYNGTIINRVAKASGMVTASLLPTISILALYYINPVLWKMLFIVFFSVVFTAAMAAFTSASRIEVFIGSVSLAGVQAVFVGNLITPNNCPVCPTSGSNSTHTGS